MPSNRAELFRGRAVPEQAASFPCTDRKGKVLTPTAPKGMASGMAA